MQNIRYDLRERIAYVTLDRPEKLNAFAGQMRDELREALESAGEDGKVRVIVLRGEGRAFCAGGDVDAMSQMQKERDVVGFTRLLNAGLAVVTTIRELSKPVIASINGVAAGAGLNLALACDYRIASDRAKLGSTFVKIGLHPDWGGTYFLPRLVGPSRALEMMMSGRMIDADEALRIGLIDELVEHDVLERRVDEFASVLASGPPGAIRDIKQAVYESFGNELRPQIRLETEHQLRAFLSDDAREGLAAFAEKRTPSFSDHEPEE